MITLKKKIFLFFIFVCISTNMYGQDSVDSLQKVLSEARDSEKVTVLMALSAEYQKYDMNKAKQAAQQALHLVSKNSAHLPQIHNLLGYAFLKLNHFDSASLHLKLAEKQALLQKNTSQLAQSYKDMATVFQIQGQYDSSIFVLEKELALRKELGKVRNTGNALINLGTLYLLKGELDKALEILIDAETILDTESEADILNFALGRIGAIYAATGDYEPAIKYLKRSVKGNTEHNNFIEATRSSNTLGTIYINQKQYDEALKMYENSLSFLEKQPSDFVKMSIFSSMGAIYDNLADYQQAEKFHLRSIEIAQKLNAKHELAACYTNIAVTYRYTNQYNKAIHYTELANDIFKEVGHLENQITAYTALINLSKETGQHAKTIEYYDKLLAVSDSLQKIRRKSSLDSLQTVFDTKYIKKENSLLQKQAELTKITLKKQKQALGLTIIVLLLISFLAVYIWANRKKIKRKNTELEHKNNEIALQAEELKTLNEKLQELDSFKTGMMETIVHDLKNPLHGLLNLNHFHGTDKKLQLVKRNAHLMNNLVLDIMDVQKYENSQMKLNIKQHYFHNLLNVAIENTQLLAAEKQISITAENTQQYSVNCDEQPVIRVLTNLLTNGIKYSPLNATLKISYKVLQTPEKFLEVAIADNGIGIPDSYKERIFDKFVQYQTPENETVRSTGLGLSFCKLAVHAHGGYIKADDTVPQGTTFRFSLPLVAVQQSDETRIIENQDLKALFVFSEKEKEWLQNYYEILKNTPLYQISTLKNFLKEIETTESPEIKKWCNDLYQQAMASNSKQYMALINLIKTNKI